MLLLVLYATACFSLNFEEWQQEYEKRYTDEHTRIMRESVFKESLILVEKLNAEYKERWSRCRAV